MRGTLRIYILLLCFCTAAIFEAQAQNVVAFFSADRQDGCSPLVVNFFDNSSGSPTSWLWDFGNGQTSTVRNPSISFSNTGLYNVTLIAGNANGFDTITRFQFIEVFQPPTANFIPSRSTECVPASVTFSNMSFPGSSPIAMTQWDFGNGNTSLQYNPSVTYNSAGNYNVSLLVIDSNGCQATRLISPAVKVGSRPTPAFSANNTAFCQAPANVNFINNSIGRQPLNFTWDFGDGSSSGQVSPSHTYANAGNYSVKLRVTDSLGCRDSLTQNNFISVIGLTASFTPDTTTVCAGRSVHFINRSSPIGNTWQWDFGDGNSSTIPSPWHSFAAPGQYSVKLTTITSNPAVCSDSVTRTNLITVLPVPNASFTVSNNQSCQPPLTASFNNTSTGAISYLWDFGDGSVGAGPNPTHTYTSPGAYRVILRTVNAQGCVDSAIVDSAVKILPPTPQFSATPTEGCAPLSVQFSDNTQFVDPLIRWDWDFGDGNTSNTQNPTHVYQNPGSYTVKLTVENNRGCIDSLTEIDFVVAGDTPIVDFGVINSSPCINEPDSFFDLSIPADRWLWSFGDSITDTIQNPTHRYQDTGFFNVGLQVWDRGCPNETTKVNLIRVLPPKAEFSYAINCNSPFTIAFTSTSQGAFNYNWDFGDGSQSNQISPVHTYIDTGFFTVTLIVDNPSYGCSDTSVQQVYIADVQAAFTIQNSIGCKPLNVSFTNNSIQGSRFVWDFGNGDTSQSLSPTYTYRDTGIYTVRLIVTDLNGCSDTFVLPNAVTVWGPYANFTVPDTTDCIPFTVNFNNQSTSFGSPIVSYNWSLGNGNTSTAINPVETYVTRGKKTIRLIVTDQNGCRDTLIKNNHIWPTEAVANFRSDTLTCPGQPITFFNQSLGPQLTYIWDFGDGDSSFVRNPTKAYSSDGTYDVQLIATDFNGCSDTLTLFQHIDIVGPVANFITSSTTATCPPFLMIFNNTSTGYPQRYSWDFGDGGTSTSRNPFHVYQTPGQYDVTMIVTSQFGCRDTIVKNNLVRIDGPIGTFDFDTNFGCEGTTVNFQAQLTNTAVIIWDFGDGGTVVGQSNRSHTYNNPGTFWPAITIQDSLGCTIIVRSEDSILIDNIPDIQLPNDTIVCQGNNVYLDSRVQSAANFQWSPTIDLACPTCAATLSTTRVSRKYIFTANSQYGCSSTDSVNILIDTIILPDVLGDIVLCPGEEVTLNQNGEVLPLNQWNPKNFWEPEIYMNDSTSPTPTINPLDTITYRLTAYPKKNCLTGSGNFARVSRIIATFYPIDKVEVETIGDTFVCPGDSVLLESNVIAASQYGYTVRWKPAFAVDRPQILSPYGISPSTTNYQIIASSTTCEPDTARVRVELKQRPFVDAGRDQKIILGSSINLYADGANNLQYQWTPPNGVDCDSCYSTSVTPDSSGFYYVRVADEFGCVNTDSVYIFVANECGKDGLFLPSAFSPNGDGNNDIFRIRSLGIQEIEFFRVFNRWGEMVFETTDINTGWDGQHGNSYYPGGVYIFSVRAYCPDGTLSEFTGNVTLLR